MFTLNFLLILFRIILWITMTALKMSIKAAEVSVDLANELGEKVEEGVVAQNGKGKLATGAKVAREVTHATMKNTLKLLRWLITCVDVLIGLILSAQLIFWVLLVLVIVVALGAAYLLLLEQKNELGIP